MSRLIDISVSVSPRLVVWPGSKQPEIIAAQSLASGDECNESVISCSVHTGTHVDAPLHFIEQAGSVDYLTLEAMVGTCQVLEMGQITSITKTDLEQVMLDPKIPRVLLRTANTKLWENPDHEFVEDFSALTPDAAQFLVDSGIKLVGIDYLSIQKYQDPPDVHQILLKAGVVILEGIDLSSAQAGTYELLCLPLKLEGLEGAPARAVLREL